MSWIGFSKSTLFHKNGWFTLTMPHVYTCWIVKKVPFSCPFLVTHMYSRPTLPEWLPPSWHPSSSSTFAKVWLHLCTNLSSYKAEMYFYIWQSNVKHFSKGKLRLNPVHSMTTNIGLTAWLLPKVNISAPFS